MRVPETELIRVDEWLQTRRRVLLYLQTLQIPPRQSRQLMRETFALARSQARSAAPVEQVMHSLFGVLSQHGLSSDGQPDFSARRWCQAAKGASQADAPGPACSPAGAKLSTALPPTRRQAMSPARMDLAPWRAFFSRRRRGYLRRGLSALKVQADLMTIILLVVVLWLAGI